MQHGNESMKLRALSVFMPRDNAFYRGLLEQILHGFRAAGVEATGTCGLLDEAALVAWVNAHRPDALFEMNRVACEVPWLPATVKHISWVVDFGGRDQSQIGGSDITYFFDPEWHAHYTPGGFSDWLPPGTSCAHYRPDARAAGADYVFVGHIPAPWNPDELGNILGSAPDGVYRFADLLEDYRRESSRIMSATTTHKDLKDLCHRIVRERTGVGALPQKVEYDLLERTKRMDSRRYLIDTVLDHSAGSLSIYGSETWRLWDRYRPKYAKHLATPAELSRAFASAKCCLHDGVGIHFRSLDCMASGGVVLYCDRQTYVEDAEQQRRRCGLPLFFDQDVHYLAFKNEDEFRQIDSAVMRDERRMSRMRAAAVQAVSAAHTWRHRAEKVVHDYENRL